MKVVILVPIKDPGQAKLRMSGILKPEERSRLAWAMFGDLIRALEPLSLYVTVVTNSERAATRATKLGWRVLWEASQISESASVDAASRRLREEGVSAVLRLPADLPSIQSRDIEELIETNWTDHSTLLVPAWDRLGTNAILRSPPDLFPSRFGHNSLALHLEEAARVQADVKILENSRIALDLDNAADLLRFMEHPSDTETHRLLRTMNLKERFLENIAD